MNSTAAQDEITSYVEEVRAALAGIPGDLREELLEDLPEHLAEVQAEGAGTLTERLGTPEAYASELRLTAGLVGGFPEPPADRPGDQMREVWTNIRRLLDRADQRIGPVIGYPLASDFLVLLRPAWWVLRGYLVAMAVAYLFGTGDVGLLPRIGGSTFVAILLLLGGVTGSIVLGGKSDGWTTGQRTALRGGTAVLLILAFAGFVNADRRVGGPSYEQVSTSYEDNPFSEVRDVFVYDQSGHLVPGARLFDQDGTPIIKLGTGPDTTCTDPVTGDETPTRSLGYPFCPQNAPFTNPDAVGSPSGSASLPAPVTSPPAARPTPTPGASRSVAPTNTK